MKGEDLNTWQIGTGRKHSSSGRECASSWRGGRLNNKPTKRKKEEAQNEASEEEKDNNSTVNIVINVAAVVSDDSLT